MLARRRRSRARFEPGFAAEWVLREPEKPATADAVHGMDPRTGSAGGIAS
jgi:hypothetical protein